MLAREVQLENSKFNDKEIKDIIELLKIVLGRIDRNGYIRILNTGIYKNIYKDYKVSDMLNAKKLNKILNSGEFELVDLFYSVNTYKTKSMATEDNIFQIVNILLDVDYKKSMYGKLNSKQFIDMLEHDIFGQVVPTPSATIFTGNNVHVIYKLKYSVNATDKAKILAKRVQKHLTAELKEFNADRSSNLTTLTRFIHTHNSKNMGKVSVKTYKNISYELRELQEWLPPLPSWYEKWKKNKKNKKENNKGKVTRLHTEYSLLIARVKDLEKLQELRNFKCYGYREVMCFLYRNFVIQIECDPDVAEKRMLEFNSKFERPLKENRIESKTRIVERHTYRYKNDTLIALLDTTEDEQTELQTIISKEEKYERNKLLKKNKRRNDKGLTKREQEKADKLKQLMQLINEGYKNAEIADIMGLKIRQIQYLKKEL